jgi:hypothetical protein
MSERTNAPRSGGRTTAQRSPDNQRSSTARLSRETDGKRTGGRGGRQYATEGTAALDLDVTVEPLRATETAVPQPRLRVAPPAPISAPRAPFIAVVITLVVAGVFGILLINTKTNENSFRISKLQDQQQTLDNQQQQLDNQLAVFDSAGNLDAAARRLGLVRADTPAYIRMPDGKVFGVPKPGEGQPAVTSQDNAVGTEQGKSGNTENSTTQNGTTNAPDLTVQGAGR